MKITLSVLLIALSSILVIGYQSYSTGKGFLNQISFNQLTAVRSAKARQVESYFRRTRNQIRTFSENGMIVEAMAAFKPAFHNIFDEVSSPQETMVQYEDHLRAYYRSEYLSRLQEKLGTVLQSRTTPFWPGTTRNT